MLFKEFGNKENPPVLVCCGIMQDWKKFYELLKPLEENYRLIVPAYDGFYAGSRSFESFTDQAIQIEEYIGKKYFGKIHGAFGFSQGGLILTELLTRNKIKIKTVVMYDCNVSGRGKISGKIVAAGFKKCKNDNKFPLTMKNYGVLIDTLYLNASDENIRRNIIANYTYKVNPDIKNNDTFVYLICESKEHDAIKSNKILKKYLSHYNEEVLDGYHAWEFLLKHPNDCCKKIKSLIS